VAATAPAQSTFDLLIRGGLVVDGSGSDGFRADVTLFDPEAVIDGATFEAPHQYPEGIPYVIVNGVLVLDDGEHTGERPGQVLRGPGYREAEADR
jgi:N-acyl-D-aspartate/D-glutamate deacylase